MPWGERFIQFFDAVSYFGGLFACVVAVCVAVNWLTGKRVENDIERFKKQKEFD